jgi:hypothetical protein
MSRPYGSSLKDYTLSCGLGIVAARCGRAKGRCGSQRRIEGAGGISGLPPIDTKSGQPRHSNLRRRPMFGPFPSNPGSDKPAKRIFDAWLAPLRDIGVRRNVIEGIGATDHVPFNLAGIPAFTVIKDFRNYDI